MHSAHPRSDRILAARPRDVVQYWLEGRYNIGLQRPTFYEYLGWALMLRGYYLYKSFKDVKSTKPEHWGYGVFDLDDGAICAAGVRLYSARLNDGFHHNQRHHPLLWRTEVCKVQPNLGSTKKTRLLSIYRLACPDTSLDSLVALFKAPFGNQNMAGFDKYDSSTLRTTSLSYLREQYDRDWKLLETVESCQYGVFELDLETFGPHGDVTFTGRYRPAGSLTPVGHTTFTRVS